MANAILNFHFDFLHTSLRNFLDNNNMGTAGYTQSAANPCGLHEEWQVYQARILLNVNEYYSINFNLMMM